MPPSSHIFPSNPPESPFSPFGIVVVAGPGFPVLKLLVIVRQNYNGTHIV